MQTEFSLQIQPSTKTAASDQDPFKTMLQKMKSRNLASPIVFRDKIKSLGSFFFKAVQRVYVSLYFTLALAKWRNEVPKLALAKRALSRVRYFLFIGRFPVRHPNEK